ncbi:MAG: hypothetical protein KBA47_01385 [Caldisericia bacterium]|nr:hypothetical protein [Caldisericia bacterium]
MSGIKFTTITLSDAIKAQLSRDNAKSQYEKNLKILYKTKANFESKYGKKLYQLDKDIEKIIGKMRSKSNIKLDERNNYPYKDYKYEQGIIKHEEMDIDNATNEIYNIQRKVAEFDKIMLEAEKETAHQAQLLSRLQNSSSYLKNRGSESEFINKYEIEFLKKKQALEKKLAIPAFVFSDDLQIARQNLSKYKNELKTIKNEIINFESTWSSKLEEIYEIENEDLKIKSDIQKEYRKIKTIENKEINASIDDSSNTINEIKTRKNILQKMDFSEYFTECTSMFSAIDSFLKLSDLQPEFCIKKCNELIHDLDILERKYDRLLNESLDMKFDISYCLSPLTEKKQYYTLNFQLKVSEIEKETALFLQEKIVDKNSYQTLLKKILALKEEMNNEDMMFVEREYLAKTLMESMLRLGYDVSYTFKEHEKYREYPLDGEFKLTNKIFINISISIDNKFYAHVIYKSSDTQISNEEMEMIKDEVKRWEEGYKVLANDLHNRGIEFNSGWIEELTPDNITILVEDQSSEQFYSTEQKKRYRNTDQGED